MYFKAIQYRYSMFRRLMNYIKNDKPTKSDHVDSSLQNLQESQSYQYPNQPLNPTFNTSRSHKQEVSNFQDTQREISDLERLRMQSLDQQLGTNTHFHELDPYEERLDSEHVMRRKILAQGELERERNYQFERMFIFDPQERVQKPTILNYHEYYKDMNKLMTCPLPEKQSFQFEINGKIFLDDYHYLGELLIQDSSSNTSLNKSINFIAKENMYSKMKFLKNMSLVDTLREEYQDNTSTFNQFPLIYDKHVYFSKDPNLGHPKHNIYKCDANNYSQYDETFPHELIFSQDRLIKILQEEESFKFDIVVQTFIEQLEDNNVDQLYENIIISDDHSNICFTVQIGENRYIHLVKQLNGHQFLISDGNSTTAFIRNKNGHNYLLYVQVSDLNVQRYVKLIDLQDATSIAQQIFEIPIYHEASLKQAELVSNEFALLSINEINQSANTLYMINESIQQVLPKNNEYYYIYDNNHDSLYYTIQGQQQVHESSLNLDKIFKQQFTSTESILFYQSPHGEEILEFSAMKNQIMVIVKQDELQHIKTIGLNGEEKHTLSIHEHQYVIQQEPLQLKNTQDYQFSLNCPYQPLRIIKYNTSIKSLETIYQQHYPNFVVKDIKTEKIALENGDEVVIFYNQQKIYERSCFLMIINDDDDVTMSMQPEYLSLLDRGFILSVISSQELCTKRNYLQEAGGAVKSLNLASKVAIFAKGNQGGYLSIQAYFADPKSFQILVAHNGVYDVASDKLLLLPANKSTSLPQPYQLQQIDETIIKVVEVNNVFISCTTDSIMSGQSRKLVAQLRRNPLNNNSNIDTYKVNFIEYQSEDIEMTLDHLAFIISASYKMSV